MSEKSKPSPEQNIQTPIEYTELPPQLQQWQQRLIMAGVQVLDVAYNNLPMWGNRSFSEDTDNIEQMNSLWEQQQQKLSMANPVVLNKVTTQTTQRNTQPPLMVGCLVAELQNNELATLSCLVAPPYNEHTMSTIQLSLGWLYYGFAEQGKQKGERAQRIMELFTHVLSQSQLREAAQEWINRTSVWCREVLTEPDANLSLLLFQVNNSTPKWWVASNVAWLERGSPKLQHASEMAARTMVEAQEQLETQWWAFPMMHKGEVTTVLVLHQDNSGQTIAEPVKDILRASSTMAEPVLRHWKNSEQPLWKHGKKSSKNLLQKLFGAGHLTLKIFSSVALIFLAIIILYPVDDIVNANLYVEGDSRWVVTAPQNGFLASVAVRPGDKVAKGATLATLEDRDLKLEVAELNSEIAQAEGRFRQAMADANAADAGLAENQKQQALSKLALAQKKLQRITIATPMSGLVVSGDWSQKIGAPVEIGTELFQVADDRKYRLVLHVLDSDIDEVSIAQTGKLKLTSLPDTIYNFEISRITSVASVNDGNNGFQVEAQLLDTNVELTPGMQGVGKVTVGTTNYISLWTQSFIDWFRLKVWSVL